MLIFNFFKDSFVIYEKIVYLKKTTEFDAYSNIQNENGCDADI